MGDGAGGEEVRVERNLDGRDVCRAYAPWGLAGRQPLDGPFWLRGLGRERLGAAIQGVGLALEALKRVWGVAGLRGMGGRRVGGDGEESAADGDDGGQEGGVCGQAREIVARLLVIGRWDDSRPSDSFGHVIGSSLPCRPGALPSASAWRVMAVLKRSRDNHAAITRSQAGAHTARDKTSPRTAVAPIPYMERVSQASPRRLRGVSGVSPGCLPGIRVGFALMGFKS